MHELKTLIELIQEQTPHGKCAIVALVVQDLLGGTILRANIFPNNSHYWNLIPGVGEIDLTRAQFTAESVIPRGVEVSRDYILESEKAHAANTEQRYKSLRGLLELRLRVITQ